MPGAKRFLLIIGLIFTCNLHPVIAQTDTIKTETTKPVITSKLEPDKEPDKKRQKKTEKIVFVSCLFIVLTTILLYNVRSK